MSETKLLPCPFCAGKADIEVDPIGKGKFLYSVSCQNIECVTMRGYRTTKEKAVEDWNARKPMERIVEKLKMLTGRHMALSEDAGEKGFEKHMILEGGKGMAFELALDIVKEEGGLNDRLSNDYESSK